MTEQEREHKPKPTALRITLVVAGVALVVFGAWLIVFAHDQGWTRYLAGAAVLVGGLGCFAEAGGSEPE